MADTQIFKNDSYGYLQSGISSSATSLVLQSGQGVKFPSFSTGQFSKAVLETSGVVEIIKITGRAGDVLTIERGQEGTIAQPYPSGTLVELRITAGSLDYITNTANAAATPYKAPVRVATTANITLSGTQTIDGVSLTVGDRVLVKAQTAQYQNGIYVVSDSSWGRADDMDSEDEFISGCVIPVQDGTAGKNSVWQQSTTGAVLVGTTNVNFLRSSHGYFAPLASPVFTGTPQAPTAATDSSNGYLATTAFVIGQAGSSSPSMNGTATVGTSLRYSRQDHIHPTDTSRAPLASPTLTGTPAAPTAAVGTNTTQIATTAFVNAEIANDVPPSSETIAGRVELATAAETTTGTDNTRAVHPAGLKVELDKKANLASPSLTGVPEAPTATAGTNTTQLATTEFVQTALAGVTGGGIVTSVAGRTGAITLAVADVSGAAPLASPGLTGTPTVPTATLGNSSVQIANTGFVQSTVNGRLAKSVAGGATVNLTAIEAGYAILDFTGALTANIAVTVPNTAGHWIVKNSTTGAYTLTFRTVAGSGVVVTQGTAWQLYCDGTNVVDAISDFQDLAFTGIPTAPTASVGTATTQLATTAFVSAEIANDVPSASETVAGRVELATDAETTAGTDTTRAVHPAGLKVELDKKAPLANPDLTGSPTAPTPAVDTNSNRIATTGFVVNQAGAVSPVMNGTATAGISLRYSRQDHVHPTDTSRAPLASPALTGTPSAPTAAVDTNTTQLATTAFVIGQGYAKLASPTFTGIPAAPTAAAGTNTTQLATTSYVYNGYVSKDSTTGAAQLPAGTTAQRPTGVAGKIRLNTTSSRFEGYNGAAWGSLGGATGGATDAVFYLNDQTINNDYTVPTGQNAMSAGPITIADSKTITISDGCVWTIV